MIKENVVDIQLQELLTKIKEEGIAKVTKESADILETAKKQAETILKGAEAKAQALKEKAAAEIQRREESSRRSLDNAARDMLLSFEQKLKNIVDRLISVQVKNALAEDALKKLILTAVTQHIQKNKEMALVLPETVKKSFTEAIKKEIQKELKFTVHTLSDKRLLAGFQIQHVHDDVIIDYSFDRIKAEFLSLVNPYLKSIAKDI